MSPWQKIPADSDPMLDLPDFVPLSVVQSAQTASLASIRPLDHLLIVIADGASEATLAKMPQGRQLANLRKTAKSDGARFVTSRLTNRRGTGVTVATFVAGATFAILTWAGKAVRECLRDRPTHLGVAFLGLSADEERRAADAVLAAAHAAAFALPSFKSKPTKHHGLRTLKLFVSHGRVAVAEARARALGNNVARWFTALPPNVLTAATYRRAIERLCKDRGIACRFIGEPALKRLGAGAFLAVARGNATRDAGILQLRYRPKSGRKTPALALVGKGVLFDTGGTNLKPFNGMLDMHTDMQGSAVALGTLLALAELEAPYAVDAWLAITENRLARDAYKPQDLVHAANGTTIQVIHTDAEGRMILADTLALAAREKPALIIDYATLTGACVVALTERYSGAFTNRRSAEPLILAAGVESGERVWPLPMDEDFDEAIKSDVADIKQCPVESAGDHILAARFLSRFVPSSLPWIHLDLSAGQHKGGLAHVSTDITGFGVRFSLALLGRATGPTELARQLSS
jgi:leucyl aminopeptidase